MYVIQTRPSGQRERVYVEAGSPVGIVFSQIPRTQTIELISRSGNRWTYDRIPEEVTL